MTITRTRRATAALLLLGTTTGCAAGTTSTSRPAPPTSASQRSASQGSASQGGASRGGAAPEVRTPPAAGSFVRDIDNPWMPWRVGTRWRFIGRTADGTERTTVTVTRRKRLVDGVSTTVVRDVVKLDGVLLEATDDWYAQDASGNVWYFGEDTKEYDGAKVDTSGSWEAGVDGAVAGIAMPAHPAVGAAYRQEYLRGQAEDQARVLSTDATARVPYGRFSGLLETRDFSRLEPTADEQKFYARHVGVVLEVSLHQQDRTELVAMTRSGR